MAVALVTVRAIRPTERPIVRRLLQLYIYELVGDHWDPEPDGTYGSRAWHRRFWARTGRHHFVIRVGGRLAGFALVCDRAHVAGAGVREISEFFVMRRYRDRGVGARAAGMLFARFPGRWEIAELSWNAGARRFWRRVLRRAARGRVVETRHADGDVAFFVHHLTTARKQRPRARVSGLG